MAARRSRKTAKKVTTAPRKSGGGQTTLVVVLLVLVVVLGYLGYAGLFSPVTVSEQETGPFSLMLQSQQGSYRQTPATIEAVRAAARSVGVEPEAACGIFLDNPREVKTADLRAQVGLVIAAKDREKIRRLPAAITYKHLEKAKCLVAEFPFRAGLSVWLGVMRVYPALNQAAAARNLERVPALEIYRDHATITYLMPIVPKESPAAK
ncbi:MAG: GyrI-like domain-containing protein [Candidatus Coatesbacteria bacterium]